MLCGSISRNKYPDFPHIPEKRSPYRMHYQNASEQMFPPENDQRTANITRSIRPTCREITSSSEK